MKIKLQLFVYYDKWDFETEASYTALTFKTENTRYRTFVCEQEVEVEVPDNYDPTQQQIASLKAEHDLAFTKFTEFDADIKNRISKLQALEYTA